MLTIRDLKNTPAGTVKIDWQEAERAVGFKIHEDLKSFWSRCVCNSPRGIEGEFNLKESEFIYPIGNDKFDKWFSLNECEGKIPYEICVLKDPENTVAEIERSFNYWTGGNDFGHRALIGKLWTDMGDFLILFNNDTGNVEWNDCGYCYSEVYEENPHGIISRSIDELLEKLTCK